MIKQIVKISQLHKVVRGLIRKFQLGSFMDRMEVDAMPRTEFAYGLYYAAMQAKMLGINSISALEFGVAGGSSLLLMEDYAQEIERITGVKIEVYGFDTGEGMPEASDHRDLPYIWEKGFFKMDFKALESKLKRAKLVIGNVRDTVSGFVEQYNPSAVGFVSIDVDYYSSAVDCLKLFDNKTDFFLPRTFCYLDDTIGDDWELHCEHVGELLAIREFNDQHPSKKISKINGLSHKRVVPSGWNEQMFVAHLFDHPEYNTYCNPKKNWQLEL